MSLFAARRGRRRGCVQPRANDVASGPNSLALIRIPLIPAKAGIQSFNSYWIPALRVDEPGSVIGSMSAKLGQPGSVHPSAGSLSRTRQS